MSIIIAMLMLFWTKASWILLVNCTIKRSTCKITTKNNNNKLNRVNLCFKYK